MPVAFSKAEMYIIEENYTTKSAREIAELLKAESGINRHAGGVWTWASRMGLNKRKIVKRVKNKYRPLIKIHGPLVPRIKPTLKNSDLFELQEKYGIRLGWIARLGDLTIEMVQDYINQGGLPRWLEEKLYIYIENNPQRAN